MQVEVPKTPRAEPSLLVDTLYISTIVTRCGLCGGVRKKKQQRKDGEE